MQVLNNLLILCIIILSYNSIGHIPHNKANLRDLIAATSLMILLQIGLKSSIFPSMWPSNLMDDLEKNTNRAPLLYYIKLSASFQTHWWIQTAVTVQTPSIWVKIGNFLSCVTLKFDGWPWKTIGHLFYATSSFVNHFKAIGESKLEWQSGNSKFRSKSAIFVPCDLEISQMTLKKIGHLFYTTSRFEHHFIAICEFELELQSEKSQFWVKIGIFFKFFLALWPWKLTDNLEKTIGHIFYATLIFMDHFIAICEFKLEIQSRNLQFGLKSTIFLAMWPWNLTDDLENQQGTAPKWYQALCIISSPYVKSNWSYVPETANLDFDLCNLDFWLLTLNFCIDITSVIGNHSWKFHDDTVMGTLWKRCERHRQTDRQTDRKTQQFFKGKSIWKCYLQNVGHFFRPKYRLIWCLFFIKVYHQPKLKREIVHISKISAQNPASVKKKLRDTFSTSSKRLQDPKWKSRLC